jgi:ketosteroid isomerase-like protein
MQKFSIRGWLVLLVTLGIMSHHGSAYAQTAPAAAVRQELLKVRQKIWEGYFRNDQTELQRSIGNDFLTINPGEEHWQNRDEFLAGAEAFVHQNGKLVRLTFPRTEIQDFGDVAVLYSLVEIMMETDGKQESLHCRSTEVFQRRQGHWVNTGAHVDSGR